MVDCTSPENWQTATSQRFESFSLRDIAPWCNGSTADFGSAGGGSNASGACYMEFVAQQVERQVVALVVAGSKPVKLPRMVG